MNRISNDVLRVIFEKDRDNFINVARVSKTFRQCYFFSESHTTNIDVMKDMMMHAINKEDVDLLKYIFETDFFHHISFENERMLQNILDEIIINDKWIMYKCFYDIIDCDLRLGIMKEISLYSVDLYDHIIKHNRVDMLRHSLQHFTYTEKSQSHKDHLMDILKPEIRSIKMFEFLYGEHLKREPNVKEIQRTIMGAFRPLRALTDLLDYMYNKYIDITTAIFSDAYYHPLQCASMYGMIDSLQWAHDKGLILFSDNIINKSIVETAIAFKRKDVLRWCIETYGVQEMGDLWSFATRKGTCSMLDFIHKIIPVSVNDDTLYTNVLDNIRWYNEVNYVQLLGWLKSHGVHITDNVRNFVDTMDNVPVQVLSFFDM